MHSEIDDLRSQELSFASLTLALILREIVVAATLMITLPLTHDWPGHSRLMRRSLVRYRHAEMIHPYHPDFFNSLLGGVGGGMFCAVSFKFL